MEARREISEEQTDMDRILMMESKLSEKDGVIETVENDLKLLRQKFEATNEELKTIEDEKEHLEQTLETERSQC